MCLENLVGIKGRCTPDTPDSDIYLNTYLPGFTLRDVSAVLSKEDESVYTFIEQQINNAILELSQEIRLYFAPRFKATSATEVTISGFYQDNKVAVSAQPTYLVGKQIQVNNYPFMEFFLSQVALQINATGTTNVLVYDLIQDKLLDTIPVTTVSGQISYATVYKRYKTQGQNLNLFIGYLAMADTYQNSLSKGGCVSCGGVNQVWGNKYVQVQTVKILNASAKLQSSIETNPYDGLSIQYNLSCSFDNFICMMRPFLAIPLAYKTGQFIMDNMRFSKNANSIINIYEGTNAELSALYKTKFDMDMETILQNMAIPDDECFVCRKRVKLTVALP